MSNFGESTIVGPTTGYGDLRIAELTPVAQIQAVYNLGEQAEALTGSGGTVVATGAVFCCDSGVDAAGFAAVLSKRVVTYRPGQGLLCRFSAIFGTPVAINRQQSGLTSSTDALMFGYDGTDFGIVHEHQGFTEVQTLTVTTPSTGSENATVTVDGTGYTVPLTTGTVQHNAIEISDSLNSQVGLYSFSSNGATVVAKSFFAAPGAAFAFTSGTAVAAWVQDTVGVVPVRDFVLQANWNVNTMPDLDPLLGNVYQIQLQWLGFGGINFYVEDPETGRYALVHIIKYANTASIPSLSNPAMRIGWFNGNSGATSSVVLKGASAAGFIEGNIRFHADPRSIAVNNPSVSTTNINLITLRSRLVYGGRNNRAEVALVAIGIASASAKTAIISLCKDADIAGDVVYEYVDEENSLIEVAYDSGEVTGGSLVASYVIPGGGGLQIDLGKLAPLLEPGETYTLSAELTAAPAALVAVDVTWKELL